MNDSHQAHLIHFLHLSKHLLIFFYLSHKASAISLPGSVSLPLVPVILPADSTAAHPEHFKHTHSPFQASFSFPFWQGEHLNTQCTLPQAS